jgi:enoyl-CoA hydratase/carnithine racemase
MTMAETLLYDRRGTVGWLRLNRPAKLNAQTPQMWNELRELGQQLKADRELRCLVVAGEGRAFSSGIDLAELTNAGGLPAAAQVRTTGDADPVVDAIRRGQEAFTWLTEAPFPSIAAVRAYALGAGLQLALACDLRIAARGAQLGALEFRYGLLPDLGATAWLPRLVGPAKAKELVFTASRIDADEALRIGLVNRVVEDAELDAVVGALAETLAAQPPLAVAGAKRAIDAFEDPRRSLELAAIGQAACLRSEDFVEAGMAFLQKRAPVYRGR